ncbi:MULTISPECIES: penicillin-binding protein 1C [unclassified Tenacibaculum]|uniref:penicillin-binding protein 1C n=1 Tax=unclassified Tenacibaculum TaxID=2635139 RepID=UPI001F1CE334|nr:MULTISPECIES: penicillin-binding protein 1C [unclassified Tenacibaculum]MCF2875596.1 penicillin-binding protein 1C [Tenacibaculum sp. Cn5-1]MCF2935672.1 penicillin-binding protein 1C [Tenacibaculum sp. Cn5-34]MCG7512232.1 penicillin-binding protein 1C [Tenacibaculum sp. Cn5-46]
MKISFNFFKKHKIKTIILSVLMVVYYFCLPKKIFETPTSTVVTASNNELLGAVVAKDGQWRFPELDSVPKKFEQCVLQFEDAYFYQHFGFNPVAIGKAMIDNIKAKKVVRGGSTITQQVIRLARKNQQRSYLEKLKELLLATRLEFSYSKKEILKLYASHAPFGGNVVGLEMASWRYFGLQPHQLSWAESATLAVLPNAPSLIYPGKNQQRLKKKRNRLLQKLYKEGIIDQITYELAVEEELPQKPYALPTIAPHLVQEIAKKEEGKYVQSSIDIHIQRQVNNLAKQHYERQKQNEVYNLAVLVLDVETRKVISYVGNSPTDKKHQKDVNNIIAPRSTGSTLKPLLYAHMLQSGDLLPTQLVADIPTEIAGYSPNNFNLTFDGAVPANEALTRSLNIPAVRMLQRYGLEKFTEDLKDYRIDDINKSADYYGLSLILGGAEASLWDLCKTYAGYAGIVNNYETLKHKYYQKEYPNPSYAYTTDVDFGAVKESYLSIDAGSAFTTLNTLTEVNRPLTDQAWKYFDSSQKIGWKTGTSFGNKDAWAIGVTPKYVVGVWMGNSDGEGRPDLTGVGSAAPLMFDVFDILPKSDWFLEPFEDLIEEKICKQSGYLALPICKSVLKRIPKSGINAKSCPYHKEITVDASEKYRVNSSCESISNMKNIVWFELPPLMAYYYQQKNAAYRVLPNFRGDCIQLENNTIDFIFPSKNYSKLSLTKNENGTLNPIILKLMHANDNANVYWYINDKYLGKTQQYHEQSIKPKEGTYKITVIDDSGNEKTRFIQIQ